METNVLHNFYKILFLESTEPMILFSKDIEMIHEFNEGFSKIFGYDRYENRKPKLSEIIKNFDEFRELKTFIGGTEPFLYLEDVVFLTRDGREVLVDLEIHRFDSSESFQYLLMHILTDREKKGNLRLKYKHLSNISHELRNPFTNISGIIEDFQKKDIFKLDSELANSIDLLEKNLYRVKSLLDNLSKIDSVSYGEFAEVFEPEKVIREIVSIQEREIRRKGLNLRLELAGSVTLYGNPFEFSQIITNLLLNSIKYTNSGEIVIALGKIPEGTTIEISDTGIGIDDQYKSRIFEHFFRVPSGEVQKKSGVGLGLSIVKELTEKMNGSISVESQPGRGTKFKLTFTKKI